MKRTDGLCLSFTALFCVLAIASTTFLSGYTMFVLSRQVAFYVLIALAQAVCLVVGGMNLSVGGIGSLATVLLGLCLERWQLSPWLAVPVALGFGCASGFANGWFITRLRIDSFVVTLSMMFLLMGLRSGISGGQPYALPESFTFVGQKALLGIPCVFWISLAVLALIALLFERTVLGRHLIATGTNADAARLAGIPTDRMIVIANVLSGFLTALAAVLWASQLGSATPETGDTWLIVSFAVAIIGGTGLNGGVISASGILLGAGIFMLIKHGLVELKANPYFANAFLGALILFAVTIDRLRDLFGQTDRRRGD
ncbi:MAG TPA: ABC transporter permease [Verrucomicrobiota bacterium]|nr:ABC transporter permease [Verrucomicrobiota bacterium]